MPDLLEDSASRSLAQPAARLRATMAAVRVSFFWFGTRKSLTTEQKAQAADAFGAAGQFLSAGKKLIDTSHPAFRAVTGVRGRVQSFWRGLTLPYPENGIRLIRQDDLGAFETQMTTLRAELEEAVWRLDEHYAELRSSARDRLGRLFNPADYPTSLQGLFSIGWDFPNVEPPDYLRQLSPALYEVERAHMAHRFDEAVRLAEEAFTSELAKLVSHLTERLSGQEDGKPKVFRDSAVENLREFFGRFRWLSVSSDQQLDELVDQAQRAVSGVQSQDLRDRASLRQHVATELAGVQATLDGLLVDRPRRNILRGPSSPEFNMQMMIDPTGTLRCIYDETIHLAAIGSVTIVRASHVEPDQLGRWIADLSPVGGPQLGPFARRSRALAAERAWLEECWLPRPCRHG